MTHIVLNICKSTSKAFRDSADYCTSHMQKISAAFGCCSAWTPRQKYYHGAKFLGMTGVFVASALTVNIEGVIGGGFAVLDEVSQVEAAGEVALKSIRAAHIA